MKKKIIILGMGMLFLCGCGNIATLENGQEAVVSFKDKSMISVDSLYKKIKDKYGISVLLDMIDSKILNKEYPKAEKEMTSYVDDNIDQIKQYYDSDADFLNAIQQYYGAADLEEFKDILGLNFLRDLAAEDYAKDKVTDAEVEKYYNEEVVGDISALHILIAPEKNDDMTDEEIDAAKAKAQKTGNSIIKKLDKAKDKEKTFKELAKEYSDDASNAKDGGDLGYFNKSEMEEAFADAAYELKDNEYTKTLVETSYGYHIIYKTGTKEKKSLKSMKEEIIEILAKEKKDNDPLIQVNALSSLRKEYGVKFEDKDLNEDYNNYINYQLSKATSNNEETN